MMKLPAFSYTNMMKHTINNSNTFLAYYNQLDKHLAQVLGLTKYMPYTEKLSRLSAGGYSLTQFVRLYQEKLRYFGDLRNQLVHGFRLDNNHYVLVSDHAVQEIKTLLEEAKDPTSVGQIYSREVYTCTTQDLLAEVIYSMKQDINTHVPVYDETGTFIEMLSESTIAYWLAEEIGDDGEVHLAEVKVADVTLENSNDLFVFVSKTTSIYDIQQLFAERMQEKKRLGAVFITTTGRPDEKIEGIITAMDLPGIAQHYVL